MAQASQVGAFTAKSLRDYCDYTKSFIANKLQQFAYSAIFLL